MTAAAALTGLIIAALGAIAYIAHIENKHDDERDGCERLPRTPGTAPRARHGRQEQGRQSRAEGAEAAAGAVPAGPQQDGGLENVPGPVQGLSPEGRPSAGPGTTSVAGQPRKKSIDGAGLAGRPMFGVDALATSAASDPAAAGTVISPCVATSGVSGSEACEPCTVNDCPAGCRCACHWDETWHDTGTIAAIAFSHLAAIPGWGDDGWVDLDAEALATDDLLTRADRLLRVPEVIA